jgi:hypothetical protein
MKRGRDFLIMHCMGYAVKIHFLGGMNLGFEDGVRKMRNE